MKEILIISAASPRHLEGDENSIVLDVLFEHLQEPVEFTARKGDPEQHGRELYSRAIFGEFGPIQVMTPPPPSEGMQRYILNGKLQAAATVIAPLEDAEKLGILTEAEVAQLTSWRLYRVALYRLPQSEGWPADVTWPEQPN